MDPNRDMLNDLYKMTKENNQMLHAMRRHAFVGGVLKLIIWVILFLAPIWFYMTYLNADVQKILVTFGQLQTSGQNAQAKINALQNSFQNVLGNIPGYPHATTTIQ